MSGLRLILLLAVLLPVTVVAVPELRSRPAPDFVLKSLDGENFRLSEYRGEHVLLTFTAAWCGHCREQLPGLESLHRAYRDAGVAVLAVSMDESIDKARKLGTDMRISFPMLHDAERTVSKNYDPSTMPLTLLIDPYGAVRFVFEGYRTGDEAEYRSQLDRLIAESARPSVARHEN